MTQSVGGIVLCGGQSSRMGRPKLSLPFGKEVMLSRVVRILSTIVRPVLVVAGPTQEVPALPADIQVLRDEQEHLGPLAALHLGLKALSGKVDAAYVSSCDVPLLTPEFVTGMIHHLGGHEIAIPKEDALSHPLAAVYRTSLSERAHRLVSQNRLRLLCLIEESDTVEVSVDALRSVDPQLLSLRNCNQPQDYETALRLAGLFD